MARMGFNLVIGMSIGDEKVHVAVVVIIEKLHSPPAHQARQTPQTHGSGLVLEGKVMVVPVDGIHLLIHVRDEEVLPTVLVVIRRIHTHAGSLAAILAVGHACFKRGVFELSVVLVHKKKIRDRIVGHKQIHPAVVINVCGDNSPGLSQGLRNP